MITPNVLIEAGLADPVTAGKVALPLHAACVRFGIATPKRIAGFLSQCAVESVEFKRTIEGLNYTRPERLVEVFPTHFPTLVEAAKYAGKPIAIANRVYANRLGNGDETSCDGWRYRGRGFIQITGRDHYRAFGEAAGVDALGNPDAVASLELAALSAAWYWRTRPLNEAADACDVRRMTLLVNGPRLLGLENRRAYHARALAALEGAKP